MVISSSHKNGVAPCCLVREVMLCRASGIALLSLMPTPEVVVVADMSNGNSGKNSYANVVHVKRLARSKTKCNIFRG
jgi:hypothetical protein